VKIPFLLRWDRHVEPGATDARLTGMVDVVPTVLDAAGIEADYALDGHSLLSNHERRRILLEYWLDEGAPGIPSWLSIRTKRVQFIEWYDAAAAVSFREYYDLQTDPWLLVNRLHDGLAVDPNVQSLVRMLRRDAACAGTVAMEPTPPVPCP
jgi:arylsulfatase A-like enzyme